MHFPQEPDGPRFWNATAESFYDLFDTTARALKAYDATLLIGGPGVSNALAPLSAPYSLGLLDFVSAHATPIDFFSWHRYGSGALHPGCYDATATSVRAYLDARGLTSVRQHVSEWAPSILGNDAVTNGTLAAAYTAAAMIYFAQHADVEVAIFYPACEGQGPNTSWGLFEDGGARVAPLWRRQGRAYEAVAVTLRDTPYPLMATFAPEEDYAVIGGASGGAHGNVTVTLLRVSAVIAAQATKSTGGFALTVSEVGWTPGTGATYSVFLIDDAHAFSAVVANASTPVTTAGTVVITLAQFAPPAVAWVIVDANVG